MAKRKCIDAVQLKKALGPDFERLVQDVAGAVSQAPDGAIKSRQRVPGAGPLGEVPSNGLRKGHPDAGGRGGSRFSPSGPPGRKTPAR